MTERLSAAEKLRKKYDEERLYGLQRDRLGYPGIGNSCEGCGDEEFNVWQGNSRLCDACVRRKSQHQEENPCSTCGGFPYHSYSLIIKYKYTNPNSNNPDGRCKWCRERYGDVKKSNNDKSKHRRRDKVGRGDSSEQNKNATKEDSRSSFNDSLASRKPKKHNANGLLLLSKDDLVRPFSQVEMHDLATIHAKKELKSTGDQWRSILSDDALIKPFKPVEIASGAVSVRAEDQSALEVALLEYKRKPDVMFVATTDWTALKRNQMSFTKGDVIEYVKGNGKWLRGILRKSSKYPLTGTLLYYPMKCVKKEEERSYPVPGGLLSPKLPKYTTKETLKTSREMQLDSCLHEPQAKVIELGPGHTTRRQGSRQRQLQSTSLQKEEADRFGTDALNTPRAKFRAKLYERQAHAVQLMMESSDAQMGKMEALLSLPKWKGGVKMHDFVKFNLSPDAQNNVAAFPDEVTAYSEIFQVVDTDNSHAISYNEYAHHIIELANVAENKDKQDKARWSSYQPHGPPHVHEQGLELQYCKFFPALNHFIAIEKNSARFHIYDKLFRLQGTRRGHYGPIYDAEYLPDHKILATTSHGDKPWNIRFWAADRVPGTGTMHNSFLSNLTTWRVPSPQYKLCWNGARLCSADASGRILFWNVQQGEVKGVCEGHTGPALDIVSLPNRHSILSGSVDTTLRLWDNFTAQCRTAFTGHLQPVRKLAYSKQLDMVASGGDDDFVMLWDLNQKRAVDKLRFRTYERGMPGGSLIKFGHVTGLHIHGNELLVADQEQVLRVFDLRTRSLMQVMNLPYTDDENDASVKTEKSVVAVRRPPGRPAMNSFTSYPDDTHGAHFVATCGNRMFEFAKLTGTRLTACDDHPVVTCIYNPRHFTFLTVTNDRVKIWDALTGRLENQYLALVDSGTRITCATVDEFERYFAIADSKGSIQIRDMLTGSLVQRLDKQDHEITEVRFMDLGTEAEKVQRFGRKQMPQLVAAMSRGVLKIHRLPRHTDSLLNKHTTFRTVEIALPKSRAGAKQNHVTYASADPASRPASASAHNHPLNLKPNSLNQTGPDSEPIYPLPGTGSDAIDADQGSTRGSVSLSRSVRGSVSDSVVRRSSLTSRVVGKDKDQDSSTAGDAQDSGIGEFLLADAHAHDVSSQLDDASSGLPTLASDQESHSSARPSLSLYLSGKRRSVTFSDTPSSVPSKRGSVTDKTMAIGVAADNVSERVNSIHLNLDKDEDKKAETVTSADSAPCFALSPELGLVAMCARGRLSLFAWDFNGGVMANVRLSEDSALTCMCFCGELPLLLVGYSNGSMELYIVLQSSSVKLLTVRNSSCALTRMPGEQEDDYQERSDGSVLVALRAKGARPVSLEFDRLSDRFFMADEYGLIKSYNISHAIKQVRVFLQRFPVSDTVVLRTRSPEVVSHLETLTAELKKRRVIRASYCINPHADPMRGFTLLYPTDSLKDTCVLTWGEDGCVKLFNSTSAEPKGSLQQGWLRARDSANTTCPHWLLQLDIAKRQREDAEKQRAVIEGVQASTVNEDYERALLQEANATKLKLRNATNVTANYTREHTAHGIDEPSNNLEQDKPGKPKKLSMVDAVMLLDPDLEARLTGRGSPSRSVNSTPHSEPDLNIPVDPESSAAADRSLLLALIARKDGFNANDHLLSKTGNSTERKRIVEEQKEKAARLSALKEDYYNKFPSLNKQKPTPKTKWKNALRRLGVGGAASALKKASQDNSKPTEATPLKSPPSQTKAKSEKNKKHPSVAMTGSGGTGKPSRRVSNNKRSLNPSASAPALLAKTKEDRFKASRRGSGLLKKLDRGGARSSMLRAKVGIKPHNQSSTGSLSPYTYHTPQRQPMDSQSAVTLPYLSTGHGRSQETESLTQDDHNNPYEGYEDDEPHGSHYVDSALSSHRLRIGTPTSHRSQVSSKSPSAGERGGKKREIPSRKARDRNAKFNLSDLGEEIADLEAIMQELDDSERAKNKEASYMKAYRPFKILRD